MIVWNFPGGWVAFGIVLTLLSVAAAVCLYFTRHRLSRPKTAVLWALRTLIFGMLLLGIADPARESRSSRQKKQATSVAVVFDTSASMRINGLLGQSRLGSAVGDWKKVQKPGETRFSYWSFDDTVAPRTGIDEIERLLRRPIGTYPAPTRLCGALTELAGRFDRENIDLAVVYTDGIDNAGGSPGEARSAIDAARTKFVIVPVTTELAMKKHLELRRLDAPITAVCRSQMPFNAQVAWSRLDSGDRVELVITDGSSHEIYREIAKRSGAGGAWLFSGAIDTGDVGELDLNARLLLNGEPVHSAAWRCRVVPRRKRRVLLMQGSHDWAVRFLRAGLARSGDTEFEVRRFEADHPGRFVPTAAELTMFDAVIILNVDRQKCVPQLQQQLGDYLKNGGGLIFITGNPRAAAEFAGSELESLLPVEFDTRIDVAAPRESDALRQFKGGVNNYALSRNLGNENAFIRHQDGRFKPPELQPYKLTDAGKFHPVFMRADGKNLVPRYLDAAPVKSAKPGAEVLATLTVNGRERPAVAVQRFGRGKSAVIATDPLWRWKLSLPSQSTDSERFWENLLAFVSAPAQTPDAVEWVLAELYPGVNTPVEVVAIAAGNPPESIRFTNGGHTETLHTRPDGPHRAKVTVTPRRGGECRIEADGAPSLRFTANGSSGPIELALLAPDHALLNQLGASDDKLDLAAALPEREFVEEQTKRTPLWPRPWLLAVVLAAYCADLILRRKEKLL
ncbi:MAG: hypothetical protein PHI35_07940 [Victivallaceae bacterium]|nr:hypothetical protein [Victivallaceae bacterium]